MKQRKRDWRANNPRDTGNIPKTESEGISKDEVQEEYTTTLESKNDLVLLYKKQSDFKKTEPLLLEALKGRRLKLGNTHPHTKKSIRNLITLYEAWNKTEKAEKWRAKLRQIEAMKE